MQSKIHKETGYIVFEDGKVLRKDGTGFLKGKVDKYGYMTYGLSMGKKYHMCHRTAHRLVADCFVEKPASNVKLQINHKDGNKLNNHYSNLEWCTLQENIKHRDISGFTAKGEDAGNSKYLDKQIIKVCEMIVDGYRNRDISDETDVPMGVVSQIRLKKIWNHVSDNYIFPEIAHQGISNGTFLWCCHKLEEGLSYRQILELYTGGEYLTYSCLKKIKARKMRPNLSTNFKF